MPLSSASFIFRWRSPAFWWEILLLTAGSIVGAISVEVFLVPGNIAPGGVSGLGVIANYLFDIPIGLFVLVGNIPIQWLGYRLLGGSKVLFMTIIGLVIYAVALEFFSQADLSPALSDDNMLNALFGGVLGGVSAGLILRAGGTAGGTATLARILQYRIGLPLSSAYLYTDTATILVAGLVFGWEAVLLAFVTLVVSGLATDYILEGPSIIRTVTIITDKPEEISAVILQDLKRGVTGWAGRGMYTQEERYILFVTINRAQVNDLQLLIQGIDPKAFIVIGQGHMAYGRGFKSLNPAQVSD